ncbi:MAG: 4-hydroxy-tetrahydrodipicolinate reductase [Spirochaetales bacterium]|uniref:4-hydroxy-tetrahydrodipicolinate reductase n=1 Tax=Candidatus Thalassospirochaeta sargassi TaxID=3119039 RepID=A0AAJ1MIJ1_9SPIO|nr:4-hydroxy-tetrahydrodipicolinate reductase [Spirochaetales bacterium]
MNVLIVGYGRMGHMIESILRSRGHNIAGRVDPSGAGDYESLRPDLLKDADAVIEFALPSSIRENAEIYADAGVAAIVGTTGWDARRDEIKGVIEDRGGTYMWGSNFSIGAHMLFILAEKAAGLINSAIQYDIMVNEYHHKLKKDSPSGTALTIAEKIINKSELKSEIVTDRLDRAIEPHELHVGSVRGGAIPGTHTVTLDSTADTIEIKHTARNREGFALGSVLAAEWLQGKKGFFRVEDFISESLGV